MRSTTALAFTQLAGKYFAPFIEGLCFTPFRAVSLAIFMLSSELHSPPAHVMPFSSYYLFLFFFFLIFNAQKSKKDQAIQHPQTRHPSLDHDLQLFFI